MAQSTELVAVLRAKDMASDVLEQVGSSLEKLKGTLRTVAIGMGAVGVGGLKLTTDARQLNAQLAQTAITVGSNAAILRKLALETANVTFSVQSVVKTFELLARAGIRSTEEMVQVANAFDRLADATYSSAEVVADMLIPAFKAFGIPLTDAGEYLDTFTWMVKNTTVNLSDFTNVMRYLAADVGELGLTIGDTVVILAALEAKGVTGQAAMREFRTAVTQAAESGRPLPGILKLTSGELAAQSARLAEATGATDVYGVAANSQFGIVAKVRHEMGEFAISVGSILEPLEGAFGAMTALTPVILFLSTQTGIAAAHWVIHTAALVAYKIATIASTVATYGLTAAQWALNVAMMANPIGIVVAAVLALAAAGYFLWKHWDTIKEKMVGVWEAIKEAVITAINFIIRGINLLISAMEKIPGVSIGQLAEIGMPAVAKMQYGGVVPGPVGAPVPIIAHGGERYLGAGAGTAAGVTVNVFVGGSVVSERDLVSYIRRELINIKSRNVTSGL